MTSLYSSIWNEPKAPGVSGPQWHDWVLVALILALSGVELAVRDDIFWLPLSLALNTLFALVLPWRRVAAVYLVPAVFGLNGAVQHYAFSRGIEWDALYTSVLILVLPFALVRWSSGKDVVIGISFILLVFASTIIVDRPPWGEIAGAILFILFPTSLGFFFRAQSVSQRRANEQVRSQERERLARDLHDTVGHYMSAIAVQAQAGRALAGTDPEAPLATLRVIEGASRSALAEMRSILRTMRGDEAAEYQPAGSLDEIRRLANTVKYPFDIRVNTPTDLNGVDGVLASTLYRLTQESITNAARHGRDVSAVTVNISPIGDDLLLSVTDNGAEITSAYTAGLGLQGMKERVALLGGEFEAGPFDDGGWRVRARLPLLGKNR